MMVGLVYDLQMNMGTLRSFIRWMIEWSRDLYSSEILYSLEVNVVSIAWDRVTGQWRSDFEKYFYEIVAQLNWLSFLWTTMNSAYTAKPHAVLMPTQSEDLLRLCVNAVQFFQRFDRGETNVVRRLYLTPGSCLCHRIDSEGAGLQCTPLCHFHSLISHSVQLVRKRHSALRLDADSWARLLSALGKTSGGVQTEIRGAERVFEWGLWTYQRTTAAHREEIKAKVLEMFRQISPEAAGTSIDYGS